RRLLQRPHAPELHRPLPGELAGRLLRGQPPPAQPGEEEVRPPRLLHLRAVRLLTRRQAGDGPDPPDRSGACRRTGPRAGPSTPAADARPAPTPEPKPHRAGAAAGADPRAHRDDAANAEVDMDNLLHGIS